MRKYLSGRGKDEVTPVLRSLIAWKNGQFPLQSVSNGSVGSSHFRYLAPVSIRSITRILEIAAHMLFRLEACHDLNVGVVAKPAEDLSPLDTLRGMGVDYAQGLRQEVLWNP